MEGNVYPEHTVEFNINPNHKPIYWILTVVMVLMDIFLIFLCLSLINPLKRFLKTADNKPKLAVICSVVTNCLFSLSAIIVTTCTVLVLISNDLNHENIIDEVFTKTGLSSYMLSQTLLILLFIIRIDETFKGSLIEYSKPVITSLYTCEFLFFIFYLFFMIFLVLEQWDMFAIFAVIWILLYFSLSLTLCILFVRKIEVLIIHCSGDHQMDPALLYLVIKHAILVPIAICSSLICLSLFIVIDYATAPGKWIPTAVFWVVLDCMMSCIGMFLLFAWNNKYYDIVCSKLHYFCEKRDILQLARSHSTTVANRQRSKDVHSKTDLSVTPGTKTKSTTVNIPSSIAISSTRGTLDVTSTTREDTQKKKKDERGVPLPGLTFVESIKRLSLSNKRSSGGKNKALESRLMDDDAIAVSVNREDYSALDRKRMEDIEAVKAVENIDQ